MIDINNVDEMRRLVEQATPVYALVSTGNSELTVVETEVENCNFFFSRSSLVPTDNPSYKITYNMSQPLGIYYDEVSAVMDLYTNYYPYYSGASTKRLIELYKVVYPELMV